MPVDRARFKSFLDTLPTVGGERRSRLLQTHVHPQAIFHVAHPVNSIQGSEAIETAFLAPLCQAFPRLLRRDELFISGSSRTGSGDWIATMGHYTGTFKSPLFGIPANDRLIFLRYGEFYRIEGDMIAEARILIDLVDLMRQVGQTPLPFDLGTEMLFPAPATHDGVRLAAGDPNDAQRSGALVEAMLTDLRAYDPETFSSRGQTGKGGYWHDDMFWYGPGGIGSNFAWEGFVKDHRASFITAFPDRLGGNHYARFGDGNFVASGGWPSLTATHAAPYLGTPATGKKIGMRVMDFWRCVDDPQTGYQIAENWVLIDMIDLFLQLGVELLPNALPD